MQFSENAVKSDDISKQLISIINLEIAIWTSEMTVAHCTCATYKTRPAWCISSCVTILLDWNLWSFFGDRCSTNWVWFSNHDFLIMFELLTSSKIAGSMASKSRWGPRRYSCDLHCTRIFWRTASSSICENWKRLVWASCWHCEFRIWTTFQICSQSRTNTSI